MKIIRVKKFPLRPKA